MLVFLIILTGNHGLGQPIVTLKKSTPLPYANNVTALELFQKTLFVIGQNATRIWIHTPDHVLADSLILFDYDQPSASNKQPKTNELRTTAMLKNEAQPALLIMGSGNDGKETSNIWIFPLKKRNNSQILIPTFQTTDFFRKVRKAGIKKFQIDGSSEINGKVVLGLRAAGNPTRNYLLTTDIDFWQKGQNASIKLTELILPETSEGITGMEYDPKADIIFFAAASAGDGQKSGNHIGVIRNAASAIQSKKVIPDLWFDFGKIARLQPGQKLQSVTIDDRSTSAIFLLQIATASDNGVSQIYQLEIQLQD